LPVSLLSHSAKKAQLGMRFCSGKQLPNKHRRGIFAPLHGSGLCNPAEAYLAVSIKWRHKKRAVFLASTQFGASLENGFD
jgi:glucose/arabinose dehydrogenase